MGWKSGKLWFDVWRKSKKFLSSSDFQIGSGAYKTFFVVRPRVKRSKLEADHSPPSSVMIRNGRNYTSTPVYTFMTRTWSALTKITIAFGVSSKFCHIQVCVQAHSAILWCVNLLCRLRNLCAVLRILDLSFSWTRLILNCYIPKIDILIDWLIDRFIYWLIDLFIYLFIERSIVCLFDYLVDWLFYRLNDRLINLFIDCLIYLFIYLSIYWFLLD